MATTTTKKTSKKTAEGEETRTPGPKPKAPRAKPKTERNEVAAITPERLAEMVNKQAHRLNEAIKKRKRLSEIRAAAQADEKEAKDRVDEELNQLRALVDEDEAKDGLPFGGDQEQTTIEPAPSPVPTVLLEDDNNAIRRLLLQDTKLPVKLRAKLIESSGDKPRFVTFGDLEDWLNSGADQGRGLTDIPGLTEADARKVRQAIQDAATPFTQNAESAA